VGGSRGRCLPSKGAFLGAWGGGDIVSFVLLSSVVGFFLSCPGVCTQDLEPARQLYHLSQATVLFLFGHFSDRVSLFA
jgi:hypothetical protein